MRAVVGLCLLDLCGSEASLLLALSGLESSLRVSSMAVSRGGLSLYKLEYTYTVRIFICCGAAYGLGVDPYSRKSRELGINGRMNDYGRARGR